MSTPQSNQPMSSESPRKRVTAKWGLNPFPWYSQMLREHPIFWNEEEQGWDIFRYQDILQILHTPQLFSSERGKSQQENDNLISRDPPRHTQLRTVIAQAFNACFPSQQRLLALANKLLDIAASGRFDLIADFALPLPILVIAELLGVPEKDHRLVTEWSKTFVSAEGKHAQVALAQYFWQLTEQKRQHPASDLISALLNVTVDGEPLTGSEVIGNAALFLIAGNETTTNFIGNAMHCFEEHPATLQQLRETPSLIPQALEEALRYRSPVQRSPRIAKADFRIGDAFIKKGQVVYLWLGAANRDPEQFDHPDQFDIHRSPNPHLAFGHGIHFCLGASLARLEARIAFECLLERFSDMQREPDWLLQPADSFFGLGIKEYPLRVSRRA